jgi:hypothetical protein
VELSVSKLFITGGALNKAYDDGVQTTLTVETPLYERDDTTFYSILGLQHGVWFGENVNVNPTPGLNSVLAGNARTYGGVLGVGVTTENLDDYGVSVSKRLGSKGLIGRDVIFREWEDFYSARVAVGVGAFGQDLSQQTFNGANSTIVLGPGTPDGDGAYVSGQLELTAGFKYGDSRIGVTGGYSVFGTDAITDSFQSTDVWSVGLQVTVPTEDVRRWVSPRK